MATGAAADSRRGQPSASAAPPRSSFGAVFGDIFLAAVLAIIPLAVLTAVLLGLVFGNRIEPISSMSPAFQAAYDSQFDSDAYYVNFSATQLTTLASWCSSVAPLLSGSIMTLFFFQISRIIRTQSENGAKEELPTPLQLSLLIGLTGGTFGPLWRWLRYMFLKTREASVGVLRLGISVLLLSIIFSFTIWTADTWLHVTTSTVVLDQPQASSSLQSFGRHFSPACDNEKTRLIDSCILNVAAGTMFVVNAMPSLTLLSNQSSEDQIITSLLDDTRISLITSASINPDTDFSANTFAVSADCKPVTKACNVSAVLGDSTPFQCSDSFKGDLSNAASCANITASPNFGSYLVRDLYITFAYDEALEHSVQITNATSNPFYFGIAAIVNDQSQDTGPLSSDPEIVQPIHGGDAFVLSCEVNIYDMSYTYSNGSVIAAAISPTNTTNANTFVAPFFSGSYAEPYVEAALRIAGLSNSSQETADKFGQAFGQILLAGTAGVMVPIQNVDEQIRTQSLVARMPKAPLFTLVAANLLYVLFGIVLVCFVSARGPRETYQIKQHLTTEGLAAQSFEPTNTGLNVDSSQDFFSEVNPGLAKGNIRVRLHHDTQTGWQFST